MIVRFTTRQFDAVQKVVLGASDRQSGRVDAFVGWVASETSRASKHRIDVMLPASGWRWVDELMFDFCFDERGFRRKHGSQTPQTTMRAVRRALNVREQHPALSGLGAVGVQSEMVPAWKFPGPDASGKRYSPYPVPTMPFVVLAPHTVRAPNRTTTTWVEADGLAGRRRILEPAEHHLFVQ